VLRGVLKAHINGLHIFLVVQGWEISIVGTNLVRRIDEGEHNIVSCLAR